MSQKVEHHVAFDPVEILVIEQCVCRATDWQGSNVHVGTSRSGPMYRSIPLHHKRDLEKKLHDLAESLRKEYDFEKLKGVINVK